MPRWSCGTYSRQPPFNLQPFSSSYSSWPKTNRLGCPLFSSDSWKLKILALNFDIRSKLYFVFFGGRPNFQKQWNLFQADSLNTGRICLAWNLSMDQIRRECGPGWLPMVQGSRWHDFNFGDEKSSRHASKCALFLWRATWKSTRYYRGRCKGHFSKFGCKKRYSNTANLRTLLQTSDQGMILSGLFVWSPVLGEFLEQLSQKNWPYFKFQVVLVE